MSDDRSDHSEGGESEAPRRKKTEHHEESHEEPWLVSYADMMTLLFGFFVLMYSFASAKNQDTDGMVKVRKELSSYFGQAYTNPFEKLSKTFEQKLGEFGLKNEVDINIDLEKMEIAFRSTALFGVGEAQLTNRAKEVVQALIQVIKDTKGTYQVRVEGHTDDIPAIHKWNSNWELSGARAGNVVEIFHESGFKPKKLSALGYGETRPLVPNRNQSGVPIEVNRSKNRRVVIVVTHDL